MTSVIGVEGIAMMINTNIDNRDAFKETMNAAYVPANVAQADTALSNKDDFMKTLQSTAYTDSGSDPVDLNFSAKDTAVQQQEKYEKSTVEDLDDKKRTEQTSRDKEAQKTQQSEKENQSSKAKESSANEKTEQSDNSGQTDKSAEQAAASDSKNVKDKAGKDDKKTTAKEVLKNKNLKDAELGNVKEGIKDGLTDAQTRDATNTAEKVVLKTVGDDATEKSQSAKGEKNTAEDKKSDNLESKLIEELEAKGKDDSSTAHKETKVQKNTSNSNTDQNFYNLLNQNKADVRQVADAKVEKAATQNNLLGQYQEYKDSITQNVENGIKVLLNSGESKINVQLTPPELGKVQLELVVKDGKVNAKINTENVAVKEVVLNNLDQLKVNLQNAGAAIDKFDVEVGGFKNQFDQYFGDKGGRGNGKGRNGGGSDASSQDANEPMPGVVRNHQAVSMYLGRSINVVI